MTNTAAAGLSPWGIEERYYDAFGAECVTSERTRAEILRAMGIDPQASPHPPAVEVLVVRPGEPTRGFAGQLKLEDGGTIPIADDGRLPPDLPIGYHTLFPTTRPGAASGSGSGSGRPDAEPIQVIASPGACFLPDDLWAWGWAVQLYAARSHASWGIGDLADLRQLGAFTRSVGGSAMMVSPLAAPAPVHPVEPSPYYPSSRRFRNPLYLRIEEIPGAADVADELRPIGAEARALNVDRRIDRERIMQLKSRALDLLWRRFSGSPAFDDYRREQGRALEEFSAYSVLAERHGKDWRQWPSELRHPSGQAVRRLIADDERVRFFSWVQWLLDQQLHAASLDVRIIHDLPIGFDIAGADGWCWQDLMAADISIGCPPDPFNLDGQDWGLAPYVPSKLRAAGYIPFIETLRSSLRHAGGLRIDHVMGLFRLFWIPRGLGAKGGTYVRYPAEELLAIIAIESQRARAAIIGEDLGTVLPGTRDILAANRLLSYRLLFFEPGAPATFPELAVSSVTTHDLATIAGIWSGAAIEHMRAAGVTPNLEGLTALKAKLATLADLPADAPLDELIVQIHRALARTPSRIILATLDDALAVAEQPNMPGTISTWPNWSLALPQSIEAIREADLPRRIAAVLRRS